MRVRQARLDAGAAVPVRRARAQDHAEAARGRRRDLPRHRRPRPADARSRSIAALAEAAHDPARTSTRRTTAPTRSARPSPASTATASASSSTRPPRSCPLLGGKEGVGHVVLRAARPRRRRASRRPRLPGVHVGAAARRRRRALPAARRRRTASCPTSNPIPADVLARANLLFFNYPNNPTGAVVEPTSSSAARARARARPGRRPRQRLLRDHLRRLPRAELPRDAGREGGRDRDVLAVEGLQHDRLARRGSSSATPRWSSATGS